MIEAGLLMGLGIFSFAQFAVPHGSALLENATSAARAAFVPAPEGRFDDRAAVPAPAESGGKPEARSRMATAGAARVIDGDTFDVAGERVRIADIDTPELRGRCAEEVRLAQAARARLRTLLAAGPYELHPIDRDEDQYGRKLRVVVRGGRSIGDQLVAEGLARTWTGRREPWC
jgi:endonuclease YncB( thermonuclease family)